ncbi:MAG TPA: 3-hydroxyacyl-CoA dehydrogenase NAD-binding domain-containing protein [Ferruginibacter sp.]|nr:3-hydroxybutyryl-CoA dehydrogenase [Ferruginibacter sp.]HRN79042.1 3-hydroxyacyl-CoA dehydrogenase NAD-binding domain-containing protein [Ferruginibacter sp.]HRO18070.1 3-hydroxyacyl-CoA dehydrogenase NAD-binding domain-containing protein [Ferruginibacter sp.]HRQ19851.1 3-hydroxyacyl-CoA dehydrogenase NAD-binding domain-containing protein [Ferruginibacter sp.]
MIQTVAIAGAGTMGSGIALSAALAGYNVVLLDTFEGALDKAIISIQKNLHTLVQKGKLPESELQQVLLRIQTSGNPETCVADLIIEAIVEKMEAKTSLLLRLASVNAPHCIIASNTSSLSITGIQEKLPHPHRVAGLHFFNPAHIMKLVEVIKGKQTDVATIHELVQFSKQLGKTPVVCTDAPGFIVNRVARHFYLESMKAVENGMATVEQVDDIMEATGFKMGPFKLMDMIGMDINLAVSQSLFEAFNHEERFRPSNLQIQKVEKGELGKKTGKGFYQYD